MGVDVNTMQQVQFTDIQLALLQARVNRFESLNPISPRFYRDSWACVASINRLIGDGNVRYNLGVLKYKPDKYYFGEHRLPFDLYRMEKLLYVYRERDWDFTLDDYDINMFTIEDILDEVRFELDALIDYLISTYDLALKRNTMSFKRTATVDQWEDTPVKPE
jgi:hypothetical protein